jgi:hypothetical protein
MKMQYEKHMILSDSTTGDIFDSPRTIFFRREGIDECIPANPDNTDYTRMMEAIEAGEAELVEVDDTSVLSYADNRRRAYASAGDQLDMQYHDAVDSTTTWKDHVAAVKAAHPKP